MSAHHYVSNAILTTDLAQWVALRKQAIESDQPIPQLPESVGSAALKIATRLSLKPNFYRYTYREDLVGDGLLAVAKYVHNFDINKTTNGFAYITQIVHNSFVRKIQVESKQTYIKAKMSGELVKALSYHTQSHDERRYTNTLAEYNAETGNEIIATYESKIRAKNQKQKTNYSRSKKTVAA